MAKRGIVRGSSPSGIDASRPDDGERASSDRGHPSLLWRVLLVNVGVLGVVVVLLSVTPITISAPIISADELALILAAFAALVTTNLVLLRRVLGPLERLTATMTAVDPERPGRRLHDVPARDAEVAALNQAFNSMLDRLEHERRSSARAALAAQESERRRVAHELHDEIGQSLTAAAIQIERAADGGGGDPTIDLVDVADAVRASLDDVRRIARRLRPEALDDLGLVNALIALCTRLGAEAGLRIERRLASIGPQSSELELVIYRVAQECLTNVVRHAQASNAVISLTRADRRIVLSISDDGHGLPPSLPGGSAGIAGMRDRASLVGGVILLDSEPGLGTTVRLEITVEEGNDADPA